MYRKNEARWDRSLRLSACAAMVLWVLAGRTLPPWDGVLLALALYPLITGLLGWDPIYVLAGFRGTRQPGDR
jgi:hypothetical protein